MKLYPPMIEGTLPAFCKDRISGITTIQIPFMMNKGVSIAEIKGFNLKIRTVQSQKDIGTLSINLESNPNAWVKETNTLYFNSDLGLNIGQFYKVQLAYVDKNDTIGYYSTVGIIKCTAEPLLSIEENSGQNYVGIYLQDEKEGDITEKIYSYCFTLYDSNGVIIETTGEQIHNHQNDTVLNQQIDTYFIGYDLEKYKGYSLEYKIRTINNLVKTKTKAITYTGTIYSELKADVICNLEVEDGYIDISLKIKEFSNGQYYLLRASNEDDFKVWNKVLNFELQTPDKEKGSKDLWKDMTIKQGLKYKYAVQQYNEAGLCSKRIESNAIQVDFEHSYLYDGERQLKIKFNPKISSFKTTLMEAKVDTIGSKYPFVFRNGNVGYKEFPISGLISFLTDENKLFISEEKNNHYRQATHHFSSHDNIKSMENFNTNLINDNIYKEREFKLEVLDWLNNGQPKLFKSPTEGNYIVRLLNVSLAPMDQLGRMLHSFSCTAYEIAESDYKNYQNFNFINIQTSFQKLIAVCEVNDENGPFELNKDLFNGREAVAISLTSMMPGDKFSYSIKNEATGAEIPSGVLDIGNSGEYIIELKDGFKIRNLQFTRLAAEDWKGRTLVYQYWAPKFRDRFDMISKMTTVFVPYKQFVGPYDNYLDYMSWKLDEEGNLPKNENWLEIHNKDLIKEIDTVADGLESIKYIKFQLRPHLKAAYKINDKYYYNDIENNLKEIEIGSSQDLYKVVNREIIDEEGNYRDIYTNLYLDGYYSCDDNTPIFYLDNDIKTKYMFMVYFDNDKSKAISLEDFGEDGETLYTESDLESVRSITIGAGIIANIGYWKKTIEYDYEIIGNKEDIEDLKNDYINETKKDPINQTEVDRKYKLYCAALEAAIAAAEGVEIYEPYVG